MNAVAPMVAAECRCPTCGAAVADSMMWDADARSFSANGVVVHFTKLDGKIFDAIWRTKGGVQSMERFVFLVYADRIDGGPDLASNVILARVSKMRQLLEPTGYTISYNWGRPRLGWLLVRTSEARR